LRWSRSGPLCEPVVHRSLWPPVPRWHERCAAFAVQVSFQRCTGRCCRLARVCHRWSVWVVVEDGAGTSCGASVCLPSMSISISDILLDLLRWPLSMRDDGVPCAHRISCSVISRLWGFFPLVSQLSIVPRLRLHRLAHALGSHEVTPNSIGGPCADHLGRPRSMRSISNQSKEQL